MSVPAELPTDAGPAPTEPSAEPERAPPRVCPAGTYVSQEAADAADVICSGCPSGTFSDGDDRRECTAWTMCEPGEYVSQKGSATADQVCHECPEGQTSAAMNAAACLPAGACQGGTVQVAPATEDEPARCEPCEAGMHCAGGSSLSHPCSDGTWDHDLDPATDCVDQTPCAPGQFVEQAGSATFDRGCADCPAGAFSLATNSPECLPLTECEPGTFLSLGGTAVTDAVCQACMPGSYSTSSNETACVDWTQCQPGEYVAKAGSATANQRCEPCATGQYSDTINAPSCVDDGQCPPGKRQTEAGTSDSPASCEPCRPGEYCAGNDAPAEACPAETWDHDADPATPCVDHSRCLPGAYVQKEGDAISDQECEPCSTGTFSAEVDVPACLAWRECPAGTFIQSSGSSTSDVVCAGCASGTFSDAANSAACVVWTDCQPGQYVEEAGTASADRDCKACPNGQYSTGINAGTCVEADQCPAGTLQTAPATQMAPAECEPCDAGRYCAGGQAEAVACSSSTWDDDLDPATPCVSKTTCVAGQYVQSAGSATTNRTCSACASGTYSTTQNASSCAAWSNCAAGRYVQTPGSSTGNRVCADCATGSFSTTQNASSCTAWSTCAAPSYYMATAGTSTTNRVCAACTPPEQTTSNNASTCRILAFQMSSGQAVMEAEHYTTTSANGSPDTWNSVSNGAASGGACMQMLVDDNSPVLTPPNGPKLVFHVNFTTTGTFYVHVRGAPPTSVSDGDSCWGGIDDVMYGNYYDLPDTAGAFGWGTHSVTVGSTGIHTLVIWGREDGFMCDKIVINQSSTAPSGSGPSESTKN